MHVLPLFEAIHTEKLEVCEGPFSLKTSDRSRYFTADVPFGLVTFCSIDAMLNVPTPVSRSIMTIASILNDTNYWNEGRTVEKFALNPSWVIEQLNRFHKKGIL
jgi:hypothetical protein